MNLDYFLKLRTGFIKYFYENAAKPFVEIKTSIENEEEPFVPPYSEDGEPPFLEEWMEAETGIETVGHACISMLSSSLHLFLKEWVDRWERDHGITFDKKFKKKGWFNGYKKIFEKLEFPITNCGADLDLIEQIALARNQIQHPKNLVGQRISHSPRNLAKFPNPFFANESEVKNAILDDDGSFVWWLTPSVVTTQEKIFEAVEQVEALCTWLEAKYLEARNA